MTQLKYFGQILAALIYTPIYIYLILIIMGYVLQFISELDDVLMINALAILVGVIVGLFLALKKFILYPYRWIEDNNTTAMAMSIAMCVFATGVSIFLLLRSFKNEIISVVIISIALIVIAGISIRKFISYRSHN